MAHLLHGRLVGQVVAPLDGVEGVLLPRVVRALGVVGQGGVDPPLGGDRVGADRVDLRDDGDVAPVGEPDRRAQPRQPTADNHHVVTDDLRHGSGDPGVDRDQDDGEYRGGHRGDPEEELLPAEPEVVDYSPEPV